MALVVSGRSDVSGAKKYSAAWVSVVRILQLILVKRRCWERGKSRLSKDIKAQAAGIRYRHTFWCLSLALLSSLSLCPPTAVFNSICSMSSLFSFVLLYLHCCITTIILYVSLLYMQFRPASLFFSLHKNLSTIILTCVFLIHFTVVVGEKLCRLCRQSHSLHSTNEWHSL